MNILLILFILVIGIIIGMGISYLIVRDMSKEKVLIDEEEAITIWNMGTSYGDPRFFDDAREAFREYWEYLKSQ